MNKARKVDLLYKIAHRQSVNITAAEQKELRKYKVYEDDANYATKSNLSSYVNEVDKGYRLSFYDWCQNNYKADRRRKGSSQREMAANNRDNSISAMLLGWLVWGMAIYWMFKGALSVGACAIAGAIVAAILLHLNRRMAGFTLFLLPIIIAVIFGK